MRTKNAVFARVSIPVLLWLFAVVSGVRAVGAEYIFPFSGVSDYALKGKGEVSASDTGAVVDSSEFEATKIGGQFVATYLKRELSSELTKHVPKTTPTHLNMETQVGETFFLYSVKNISDQGHELSSQADVYSIAQMPSLIQSRGNVQFDECVIKWFKKTEEIVQAKSRDVVAPSRNAYCLEREVESKSGGRKVRYDFFTDDLGRVTTFTLSVQKDASSHWKPGLTYGFQYQVDNMWPSRTEIHDPESPYGFQKWQITEFTSAPVHQKLPMPMHYLTSGTLVIDHRFEPSLKYSARSNTLLSDDEVMKLVARRKAEKEFSDQIAIPKTSAVANDPHNMKDVPVTGESWGNRLRRIPNWAYGGAAVLFLGGWFVAASRRRRK